MRLIIMQYNREIATVDRRTDLPYVTETDEFNAKQVIQFLKVDNKVQIGYYDVVLLEGDTQLDLITLIC